MVSIISPVVTPRQSVPIRSIASSIADIAFASQSAAD